MDMSTFTSSTPCVDPLTTYHSAFPALQALPWASSPQQKKRHSFSHHLAPSLTPPKPPSYLKQTHYASLVQDQYQHQLQRRYDAHQATPTKLAADDTHTWQPDLRLPTNLNVADKSNFLEVDKTGLSVHYTGPGRGEEHAGTVRANLPMPPQCGVYYFEMVVKSKGVDGYIGIGFCGGSNKLERLPGWDMLSYGYHGDDGHSFEGSGTGKTYGPRFSTGDVIGCGVNFANGTAFYTKNGLSLGVAFTDIDPAKHWYPCIGMRTVGECVDVNFGQNPFVYDIAHYIQEQKQRVWQQIDGVTQPNAMDVMTRGGNASSGVNSSSSSSSSIHARIGAKQRLLVGRSNASPTTLSHSDSTSSHGTTSSTVTSNGDPLQQLILSYLIHHGYTQTATAVIKETTHLFHTELDYDRSILGLDQRLMVMASIMRGDIDGAIELLMLHFAHLMKRPEREDGSSLIFQLECQKFVELIHQHTQNSSNGVVLGSEEMHGAVSPLSPVAATTPISTHPGGPPATPASPAPPTSPMPVGGATTAPPPPRRMSWAAIVATPTVPNSPPPQHQQQQQQPQPRRLSLRRGSAGSSSIFSSCSSSVGGLASHYEWDNDDDDIPMDNDDNDPEMHAIMTYGQQLKDHYGLDAPSKVRSKLKQIFSLLAYPNPKTSPVAYLLDRTQRETLASQVNAAILVDQRQPESPALDRLYRQAIAVNKSLACLGHGESTLINLANDAIQ
ncbi:hypothetical protein BC940DRAFT_314215 [Gongronella butleri]|nr:hypothetical protein BC940DRAFT_314215 [Gongronella butleri]